MSSINDKRAIKKRIAKFEQSGIPSSALERSRMYKSLQVTKSRVISNIHDHKAIIKDLQDQINESNNHIKKIDSQLALLEEKDNQLVTEHALLRYVERVMGVDLEEVHEKILNLPKDKVYKAGKTVVTVLPDNNGYEDHFNLAENELV